MGADAVLFYRYLAAVPIMGAMAAFRGRNLALHRRELLGSTANASTQPHIYQWAGPAKLLSGVRAIFSANSNVWAY